jgi:hypothetical protein
VTGTIPAPDSPAYYPGAEYDIPVIAAYAVFTGRTSRDWAGEPGPVRDRWRTAIHHAVAAEHERLRTDLGTARQRAGYYRAGIIEWAGGVLP